MTETWATTYCAVCGLFELIRKHATPIYCVTLAFVLGMIFWWYVEMMLS